MASGSIYGKAIHFPAPSPASAAQPHPNLRASAQKNGSTFLASFAAEEPFIRCSVFR